MPSQLTDLVRKKFPGQYDDLDDATLEKSVLAKHPEYKDLATPPKADFSNVVGKSSTNVPAPLSKVEQTHDKFMGGWQPPETSEFGAPTKPEPDTLWGGRLKGIKDYANELMTGQLQSMAQPQTVGDFLGLIIPNEFAGVQSHGLPRGGEEGGPPVPPVRRTPNIPLPADIDNHAAIMEAIRKPPVDIPRPEGAWNSNIDLTSTSKPQGLTEDKIFEMARQKHMMGQELPSTGREVIPEIPTERGPLSIQDQANAILGPARDEPVLSPIKSFDNGINRPYNFEPENLQQKANDILAPIEKPRAPDLTNPTDWKNFAETDLGANPDIAAEMAIDEARRKLPNSEQIPFEEGVDRVMGEYDKGTPLPDAIRAEFLGHQPTGIGDETTPLFNVIGGPSDKSTVTLEGLQKLGIEAPEVPSNVERLSGDQIRQKAIKNSQDRMDAKSKGFRGTVPDESIANDIVPERQGFMSEKGAIGKNINDPVNIKREIDDLTRLQQSAKLELKQASSGAARQDAQAKLRGLGMKLSDLKKKLPLELPNEPSKPNVPTNTGTGNVPPSNSWGRGGSDTTVPLDPRTQALLNRRGSGNNLPPMPPTNKSNGPKGPIDPKIEPLIIKMSEKKPQEASALNEAWNLSRGLMSVDLPFITSAGLRQGLPLIGTKNWIKAWGPSIKSYGSKAFYDSHLEMMKNDSLMKRGQVPVMDITGEQMMRKGQPVFKETPSIGENAGVKLTDLGSLSGREESIRSQLAERIPVWGKVVAASNRAYTAYINDLRLNTFRQFHDAMPDKNNMPALKELGELTNVLTGRGSLKASIPREIGLPGMNSSLQTDRVLGSLAGKEGNLEKYAQAASNILFAPKLITSRLKMLNPASYLTGSPQARKEYLKAALRTAGAITAFGGLAKLAGADVNLDSTNPDFMKIKVGNTRLDPGGGFLQFVVLASKLAQQESTSSTTGKTSPFGGKSPYAATTGGELEKFVTNKLHPNMKKLYDAAFAKQGRPYHVIDRELQSWIPMMTGDLIDIAKENPELAPALAPLVSAGMGLQNYGGNKDFNKPMILPEKYDLTLGSR